MGHARCRVRPHRTVRARGEHRGAVAAAPAGPSGALPDRRGAGDRGVHVLALRAHRTPVVPQEQTRHHTVPRGEVLPAQPRGVAAAAATARPSGRRRRDRRPPGQRAHARPAVPGAFRRGGLRDLRPRRARAGHRRTAPRTHACRRQHPVRARGAAPAEERPPSRSATDPLPAVPLRRSRSRHDRLAGAAAGTGLLPLAVARPRHGDPDPRRCGG